MATNRALDSLAARFGAAIQNARENLEASNEGSIEQRFANFQRRTQSPRRRVNRQATRFRTRATYSFRIGILPKGTSKLIGSGNIQTVVVRRDLTKQQFDDKVREVFPFLRGAFSYYKTSPQKILWKVEDETATPYELRRDVRNRRSAIYVIPDEDIQWPFDTSSDELPDMHINRRIPAGCVEDAGTTGQEGATGVASPTGVSGDTVPLGPSGVEERGPTGMTGATGSIGGMSGLGTTGRTGPDVESHEVLAANSEADNAPIQPRYQRAGTPTILFRTNALENSTATTLKEIIFELNSTIDIDSRKNIVNVVRTDVLDGGKRAFKKPRFNLKAQLDVKFVDEAGIDGGGLTQEFMRLALNALKDSSIFEGPDNAKQLIYSYNELQCKEYYHAGLMIGYFIVHGGPLPQFFHELTYRLISNQPYEISVDDVLDHDLRDCLRNISSASDELQFSEAINKIADLPFIAGCGQLVNDRARRNELVHAIVHFILIEKNRGCVEQFCEGLSLTKVLEKVHLYPEIMKEAFLFDQKQCLTAPKLLGLFKINFSDNGSNKRRKEDRVISFFRDFVEELEDENRLEDLLIWATGAETIPALGFTFTPQILFGHPQDTDEHLRGLPKANTCALTLELPIIDHYETFCLNMRSCIVHQFFTTA